MHVWLFRAHTPSTGDTLSNEVVFIAPYIDCCLDYWLAVADIYYHLVSLQTGSFNLSASVELNLEGLASVMQPTPSAQLLLWRMVSGECTVSMHVTMHVERCLLPLQGRVAELQAYDLCVFQC